MLRFLFTYCFIANSIHIKVIANVSIYQSSSYFEANQQQKTFNPQPQIQYPGYQQQPYYPQGGTSSQGFIAPYGGQQYLFYPRQQV